MRLEELLGNLRFMKKSFSIEYISEYMEEVILFQRRFNELFLSRSLYTYA